MPGQSRTDMSRRTAVALGAAGALIVALVLGASLLMRGGSGSTGQDQPATASARPASAGMAELPDLVGVRYPDAEKRLAERGLGVAAVVRVPSARHADTVVRTYPTAGSEIPTGTKVTLYVSSR